MKTRMMIGSRTQTYLLVAAALFLIAGLLTGPAVSGPRGHRGRGKKPPVLPVQSKPYGLSYGEWSARHWEWVFSMPEDQHPLTDTADCSEGQSGKVWFLGGTFAPTQMGAGVFVGIEERDCTISTGTALFFPILDVECSTIEGDGETEEELRDCANFLGDFIVPESLFLKIDGIAVSNLEDFRVESPLFVIGPLPENNLLGAEAGEIGLSVSDGVFVMLPPLSKGKHTIEFGGLVDAMDELGFSFMLDIKYNITVKPGRRR